MLAWSLRAVRIQDEIDTHLKCRDMSDAREKEDTRHTTHDIALYFAMTKDLSAAEKTQEVPDSDGVSLT